VEKSIDSSSITEGVEVFLRQARNELCKMLKQSSLFPSHTDSHIAGFLKTILLPYIKKGQATF
jgi:hypothetical protein